MVTPPLFPNHRSSGTKCPPLTIAEDQSQPPPRVRKHGYNNFIGIGAVIFSQKANVGRWLWLPNDPCELSTISSISFHTCPLPLPLNYYANKERNKRHKENLFRLHSLLASISPSHILPSCAAPIPGAYPEICLNHIVGNYAAHHTLSSVSLSFG